MNLSSARKFVFVLVISILFPLDVYSRRGGRPSERDKRLLGLQSIYSRDRVIEINREVTHRMIQLFRDRSSSQLNLESEHRFSKAYEKLRALEEAYRRNDTAKINGLKSEIMRDRTLDRLLERELQQFGSANEQPVLRIPMAYYRYLGIKNSMGKDAVKDAELIYNRNGKSESLVPLEISKKLNEIDKLTKDLKLSDLARLRWLGYAESIVFEKLTSEEASEGTYRIGEAIEAELKRVKKLIIVADDVLVAFRDKAEALKSKELSAQTDIQNPNHISTANTGTRPVEKTSAKEFEKIENFETYMRILLATAAERGNVAEVAERLTHYLTNPQFREVAKEAGNNLLKLWNEAMEKNNNDPIEARKYMARRLLEMFYGKKHLEGKNDRVIRSEACTAILECPYLRYFLEAIGVCGQAA